MKTCDREWDALTIELYEYKWSATCINVYNIDNIDVDKCQQLFVTSKNRCSYEKPTPIQAQAIPTVMSGRDMIGKTLLL